MRNPKKNPAPSDVPEERMKVYRELFFNNSESFISSNFPVLRRITDDEKWFELVQDFFENHKNQTPYFPEIPEEFLSYLQNEREAAPSDPPFMLELAHYEWAEAAISAIEGDAPVDSPALQNDPLNQKIALSPVAWALSYHYPVHKISPQFQPQDAPETASCLVVYRNRQDDVGFMEINAVTYRLLQLLGENPGQAAKACLQQIADELKHPNPDAVINGGAQLLQNLSSRNIICCL
ncbi:MAG: DUF2063 domain-containing protein [Gammaproteobacteria bacterium]|nr:MAG: DUF2063 domain-containing protein [Gammaproteobacteria bacterium]